MLLPFIKCFRNQTDMEISEKLKYRLDLAANKSNLSHDEFLIAVKYAFNSIVDLNASLDGEYFI